MSKLIWPFALLVPIALALFAFSWRPALERSPEDAEARRIVDACAIGGSEAGRAGLAMGLSRRLRELNAEGAVTSTRVGAILDKIGPDAVGRDTYAVYVQCLKQQTELSLRARGVRFDTHAIPSPSPSPSTVPAEAETVVGSATKLSGGTSRQSGRNPARGSGTPAPEGPSRTAPPAQYKTGGDCSPIIVGSHIENLSQRCEDKTQ